jgi:glycosyltransferase involved in cell wall biosynthesis
MKKKILIFHPALAPYRVDQFNTLSQLFDLEVVFIYKNVPDNKFNQSRLLSLLHFKYSFLLFGPYYKGRVFRFGMYRTIKRTNPDIILGYEYSFTTQYLILLKRLGIIHQKIGSTIDDSLDICNNVQSKSRFFARKIATKRLDYLIVLSKEVSQFYQKAFNLKENQIVVSPILQDSERLRMNREELENIANGYAQKYHLKGKKVLLFVGRFIPEKALPEFINNIQTILHEQENLVLILVGDGIEKKNIETLINEKQLQDKVVIPGRYEGQRLNAWYLCSSGFVLPSTYEPFGAVVNEALIFGLKVLCSKYAGSSYLVSDDKGILFDALSENDTIDRMKLFISSIDVFEQVDMMKKQTLMTNHQHEFNKEWGKLIHE